MPPSPFASSPAVLCFGELLLRLGAPGASLLLQEPRLDVHVGGAEANVAAGLAWLGHHAALVGAVPDNPLGRGAVAEMRRHGVDVSALRVGGEPGRMGLYFLAPGAVSRPADIVYDRAGSRFALSGPEAYDWPALLRGVGWLHVSGITPAVSAAAAAAALAAVDAAQDAGVALSFDGNFRPKLWQARGGDAPAVLRRFAQAATLMFGNERDIALLLGPPPTAEGEGDDTFAAAAARAFAHFPRLRWLASTARVADSVADHRLTGLLASRDGVWRSPTHVLRGIVDRIGSGDAYAAGVLHGLMTGLPPADTVAFATAAAALKHAVPGDANRSTVADVRALLSEEGLDVRR